jgi:hypothetical protein
MYDARLPPCASRSGFQPVKYSSNILAVMAASRMSLGNAPSPTEPHRDADLAARAASAEFESVRVQMRKLYARFERQVFAIASL